MLPNFMLIGPGRAASTWVTKNLMLHPDIYMPRRKVTRFFIDNYDRGIDWYMEIFGSRTEKAIGEASVGYLHTAHAPALIRQHMPDIKLIANLRDPVSRTYSSYGRLVGMAKKGTPNFDISFEEKIEMSPELIERSKYAHHLKGWFKLFPRENFLILTFEDLVADSESFLKSIYNFLEVDADFESPLKYQQVNSTASISLKSQGLYQIYRALLRFELFKFSKVVDSVKPGSGHSIRPETRKRLIEKFFLEDINELESMIGRDLTSWKV